MIIFFVINVFCLFQAFSAPTLLVDVEFPLVPLQHVHGHQCPQVISPNTKIRTQHKTCEVYSPIVIFCFEIPLVSVYSKHINRVARERNELNFEQISFFASGPNLEKSSLPFFTENFSSS